MLKVASFVFNSFVNDSRVLKTAKSLTPYYNVEVIAHNDKGLKEEEKVEGFMVKRFSYLNRKITKTKLGKLKVYLIYLYKSIKYCKNHDFLHCNDLNTLIIGYIIKKFYNKNSVVIYDAHEYETEINGLKGIQKSIIKSLEKFLIPISDHVITVSDAIADEYVRLYDISKPSLILNTPNYQEVVIYNKFREIFNLSEKKIVFLYQGGLSKNRGIEILLDSFSEIVNKDMVIVLMGYGPLESLVKKYALKYDNIYFHDAVSPSVLLNYTSSADFGILFYENSCLNHEYCSPNKMFEYLMAEVPVISSNLYEMKQLVTNHNIGIVAEENTVHGFINSIKKASFINKEELIKNIKRVKKIYNWEEQEKKIVNIYKRFYS